MVRVSLLLAFAAALPVFPAGAQIRERPVPAEQPLRGSVVKQNAVVSIFTLDSPLDSQPVTFRTPEQMTERDRNLEANAASSIARYADRAGLEFNQGKWSYGQIVCPAFPQHLFLRYTRNQGKGDVSVFTASIPRDGEGRVRIIPIERRSYSLFSPASENALTIDAFHHIRGEEPEASPTPWVGMGLCYAALAGASLPLNPTAQPGEEDTQGGSQNVSSILNLEEDGGAVLRFTHMRTATDPTEWALTFDRKGNLVKSSMKSAGYDLRVVPSSEAKSGGSAAAIPPA